MTRLLITGAVSLALTGIIGFLLLPVLRALKAGQSVREIGPTWHNYKAGTPMMGGLMFIFAAVICMVVNLFTVTDYTVYYVLGLGELVLRRLSDPDRQRRDEQPGEGRVVGEGLAVGRPL